MIKSCNTQVEIYIGNTIQYDAKSHQRKMTILKTTNKRLKELQFNLSQKEILAWTTSACDVIQQN